MRKLTMEEIRAKQLEMLDYIDALCRKNNLRYFLAYGTLLGAIRHKGYIPWDDDIDIWLLREDYDAFREAVLKEQRYKFVDTDTNSSFRLDFAKLADENIVLHEKGAKEASSGLFIDIFPLDNFGDTEEEVKKNLRLVSKKRKKFYFCNFSLNGLDGSFLKRYVKFHIVIFHKFLLLFNSPLKLIKKYHQLLQGLSQKYKKYVGYFDSPYQDANKYIYKREDFAEAKGIFEGKEYIIPANYDGILTKYYGDYMKLPPVSEQKNHGIEAYLKEEV